MANILIKIKNFMAGRNGIDKLTYGLLVIYCLICAVKVFLRAVPKAWIAVSVLQVVFVFYILYRIFSRNLQKRYRENVKFEQFLSAWKPYFEHLKLRVTYARTHRFRTCKHCGEFLRLKKGRGKRVVKCPKCGAELRFHFLF